MAQALDEGVDELLLPMVRSPLEVQRVLDLAGGRCGVGILVETRDAVREAAALGQLPLARAYLGLNDLAIERASRTIFAPVLDGTLQLVRRRFRVPFGFGGLTLPEAGTPIPCRLLMAEMVRLGCRYSFLRRSFLRDVRGRDVAAEVTRMLTGIRELSGRPEAVVEGDRQALRQAIARAETEAAIAVRPDS